jgi:hypothetical protein
MDIFGFDFSEPDLTILDKDFTPIIDDFNIDDIEENNWKYLKQRPTNTKPIQISYQTICI